MEKINQAGAAPRSPKFTPGPWVVAPQHEAPPFPTYSGIVALVADSPRLYIVLDTGHALTRVLPEQWEANARLIAAAPDLYEALGALMRDDLHSRTNLDRAFAALAKAEDRPSSLGPAPKDPP